MALQFRQLSARRTTRLLLGAAAAAMAIALRQAPLAQTFEHQLYDLRIRLRALVQAPSPNIVIVGIDDDSLEAMEAAVGRWPWPRYMLASIVDHCSEARVIGIDILLTEADRHGPVGDDLYVDTVRRHGNVVNAIYFRDDGQGTLPPWTERYAVPDASGRAFPESPAVLAPFPRLLEATAALGATNHNHGSDSDGVLRAVNLAHRHRGLLYPSLPLAMALRATSPAGTLAFNAAGAAQIGQHRLPVAADGRMYLCPSQEYYTVYRAADVLNSWQALSAGTEPSLPRSAFKDKLVLIGSTATGVEADREVTSLAAGTFGVGINATALDNLLSGDAVRPLSGFVEVLFLLLLALLPTIPDIDRPRTMLLSVVGLAAAFTALDFGLLFGADIMLAATGPAFGLVAGSSAMAALHWAAERQERRRLEELELAKQQFTDMLVHDMKNRVSPIIMSLHMVADMMAEADDELGLGVSLETARLSTERLQMEMKSLLDIRKMSEGQMQLNCRGMRASELIDEAAAEMQPAVRQLDLSLAIEGSECPARVRVDKYILNRILMNLVWNAIDHSPPETAIEMSCELAAGTAVLAVANHGPVIPTELQESIFEAFVSGTRSGKESRSMSGTGLGLAFCKLGAEAHGGNVQIASPWPGHEDGVKVLITIPLAADDASEVIDLQAQ
jgi:signal transduction histidine kinase